MTLLHLFVVVVVVVALLICQMRAAVELLFGKQNLLCFKIQCGI